jgi:hypothetical protein
MTADGSIGILSTAASKVTGAIKQEGPVAEKATGPIDLATTYSRGT